MADQTFGQSSVQHMSIQTRFFNLQHWLKYIPGNRYTHPSLQFTVLSQLCKIVKQHHSTNEKKSLQKKNSIKVFSANLFSFVILEIKIWKKYAYHISKTDKVIELLYTPDLSLLVSYLEDCLPLAMVRSFIKSFYQSHDGSSHWQLTLPLIILKSALQALPYASKCIEFSIHQPLLSKCHQINELTLQGWFQLQWKEPQESGPSEDSPHMSSHPHWMHSRFLGSVKYKVKYLIIHNYNSKQIDKRVYLLWYFFRNSRLLPTIGFQRGYMYYNKKFQFIKWRFITHLSPLQVIWVQSD